MHRLLLLMVVAGVAVAFTFQRSRRVVHTTRQVIVRKFGPYRCGGYLLSNTSESVDKGLLWLARHQSPDGGWDSLGFAACCSRTRCRGGTPFVDRERTTAVALLAFLGADHTYASSATVRRATLWLRSRQGEDGLIGPDDALVVPRHSLATFALIQAWAGADALELRRSLQKAVDRLEALRTRETAFAPRVELVLSEAHVFGLRAPWGVESARRSLDWSALEGEPPRPRGALVEAQLTALRGCGEGSFTGSDGPVYETARAVIELELRESYGTVSSSVVQPWMTDTTSPTAQDVK
jgi:hypothetical protein